VQHVADIAALHRADEFSPNSATVHRHLRDRVLLHAWLWISLEILSWCKMMAGEPTDSSQSHDNAAAAQELRLEELHQQLRSLPTENLVKPHFFEQWLKIIDELSRLRQL
jgi:hypothetical protein